MTSSGRPISVQSPFQKTKVKCPICENESFQWKFRQHLYTIVEFDVDFYPKTINWNSSVDDRLNPSLYYMWHCKHCLFTASYASFEEPTKDYSMVLGIFRKKIKTIQATPSFHTIIQKLGENINYENMTYLQAAKLHLLGAFFLLNIEEIKTKDAMDIGRYFLHLAWIFRDAEKFPQESGDFEKEYAKLIKEIPLWHDVPKNDIEAMNLSILFYNTALLNSYYVQNIVDEIKMGLLISRIYMRLDKLDEAKTIIWKNREKASKFEALRRKKISRKDEEGLSIEKIDDLTNQSQKIKNLVDETLRSYEKLLDTKEEAEIIRAKKIIKSTTEDNPETLRIILSAEGVAPSIINKLIPETDKKEKKGLFGLFK